MGKFSAAGRDILNTLKLADTNHDGTVDLREFITTLSRANVKIAPDEINFIYEAIDDNADGKLQYKELVDVLQGRKQIDVRAFVTKRRERLGINTGVSPSEMARGAKHSKEPHVDSAETRTVTTPSGMTSLMQRSAADGQRNAPQLVDEGEHTGNYMAIKEAFLHVKKGAFSFEDLLQAMGVPAAGANDKVTLIDFTKAVQRYCGPSRFSSYQIKFVFQMDAKNIGEGPDALDRAYIPIRDFKDRFYPGRPWAAEYESKSEVQRRRMMERDSRDSKAGSITSESVHISTVMQGLNMGDVLAAKDAEERRQLLLEQKARQGEDGEGIASDLDAYSEASFAIDRIIQVRNKDPKQQKPGQATTLADNVF